MKSDAVTQLRELAIDPPAQAAYAASLLDKRVSKDVLSAALAVLAEHPWLPARAAILRHYAQQSADKGVRDQGAYFRRMLIDALRPIAEPADAELLAAATQTYEFWPPDFAEDAVLLRAAALVALKELDDDLTRFHAARLLVDPHFQEMSGEPAVTAARVLGALGEVAPLWMYVWDAKHAAMTEVTGECLRQLTALPLPLIDPLVAHFGEGAAPAIQLGIFHLLIYHQAGVQGRAYLQQALPSVRNIDLYRYLVMSMIAVGDDGLLEDLIDHAGQVRDARRAGVLLEAAELAGGRGQVRKLLDLLRPRNRQ